MAQTTNCLTFSLSPMEMLKSSFITYNNSSSPSPYLIDNFYVVKEEADSMADSTTFATYHPVPKLEDFLGDGGGVAGLFSDHHHGGFQTNSGSVDDSGEYKTYLSNGSEFVNGHVVVESPVTAAELGFHGGVTTGETMSLRVNDNSDQAGLSCDNGERGEMSKKKKVCKSKVESTDEDSKKKTGEMFGQRTSIYRGVTRHRWTGRYEAHLWDNSCRREGQARKGRQVYLGGYEKEDIAARAYDLAALKYWGPTANTNFQVSTYSRELEEMNRMTKQEFIASLRRKSSGFSRGASIYRGVTRHHQQGRWQSRIGRVAGNKDLYLGTFATEEEAAEAYDIAAIKFRGLNAVTNFEMNRYDVEAILNSSFPVGAVKRRHKLSLDSPSPSSSDHNLQQHVLPSSSSDFNANSIPCGIPFESSVLYHHQNIFQHYPLVSESPVQVPMMNQAELLFWPNQSY